MAHQEASATPWPSWPTCVPLEALADEPVGGKADGLARLLRMGLAVPKGFVVVGAAEGALPRDLVAHYEGLGGGRVAVRSSAVGEDGAAASFAGQYETLLDVEGVDALRRAVDRCLRSASSDRAATYRGERTSQVEAPMAVVVQRMVDARVAGVLFTAEPLTGRRDLVVIDAIRGSGAALVSGTASPDRIVVGRDGALLVVEAAHAEPALTADEARLLASEARRAEAEAGHPLDMEWAIDGEGRVSWLQARPVTALPGDPRELDLAQDPGDVCTSCSIGECMPGAVTPLAFSTVWRGNDEALQRMHLACGILEGEVSGYRFTRLYYGRLHLNMTKLGRIATHVVGSTTDRLCLAICGRVIPELDPGPRAPALSRALSGAHYVRYLLGGARHAEAMERLVAGLRFPEAPTAAAMYAAIDRRLPALMDAFDHHMVSSAGSGALEPTLMEVHAKGRATDVQDHAALAALLAGASRHDVESADLVAGVDRIVARLLEHRDADERFGGARPAEALAWLRSPAAGAVGLAFSDYLDRHGHRCIRELELREPEWAAAPESLVESIQASYRAHRRSGSGAPGRGVPRRTPPVEGRAPAWLVRLTQAAVARRERTKSLLVLTVTKFKQAYRHLSDLLVAGGLLPDRDAVFFLTHEELGAVVRGARPDLAEVALRRRAAFAYQMEVTLPDVFSGDPEPLLPDPVPLPDGALRGKPVSRGRVEGRARVARSLDEAAALEAGEILVAPVTDVAWSPYFSIIAGLATDVGSSVSHAAVVAREYGLPAVVDLRRATRVIRTGDRVALDGDQGTLTRLSD